jgi:hypothetical protein
LLVLFALATACQPNQAGPVTLGGSDAGMPGMSDGGVLCARPAEGCACNAIAPIDCYLDATALGGGETLCHRGSRYCRANVWSACESIHDYTISTSSALVSGPTTCNPCDPACYITTDTTSAGDLTPTNSMNASYDPTAPSAGIVITAQMSMNAHCPPGDTTMMCNPAAHCAGLGIGATDCVPGNWTLESIPLGMSRHDNTQPYTFTLTSADVYILMDTTASMDIDSSGRSPGELTNLRNALTSGTYPSGATCGVNQGILGAIQCAIPSAYFGVGEHDDYPYCPDGRCYGWPNATQGGPDAVYHHILDMTGTLSAAQTAVNGLTIHNGADGPESQIPSMDVIVTGGGLGSFLAARSGCPAGTRGYPCFRATTVPIIINITDAPYHNGPANALPYCIGGTLGAGGATAVSGSPCTTTSCTDAGFCTTASHGNAIELGEVFGNYVSYTGTTAGSSVVDHSGAWTCSGATSGYVSGHSWVGDADMVFHFHLNSPQVTTISTMGSSLDTMIWVTGATVGNQCRQSNQDTTSVNYCNDDYGGTYQSRIDVLLAAGDYYVVVDGYSNLTGAFTVMVGQEPTTCANPTHVPPTFAQTAADLRAAGAYVITAQSCGNWSDPYCLDGEANARALANATGSLAPVPAAELCATPTSSQCRVGNELVYRLDSNGAGLSTGIVNSVVDLANYLATDVGAYPVGDTYGFVQAITPNAQHGSGSHCAVSSTVTDCFNIGPPASGPNGCFSQCTPGADLGFSLALTNTHAPPGVYYFYIAVVAVPSGAVLERIPVRIIVNGPATTYPTSATYFQDYNSTTTCAINECPAWGVFSYTANVPANTSITFTLISSNSSATLATATPTATITVNSPAGASATTGAVTGTADIGALLMAAGAQSGLAYLRVLATLYTDPTMTETPSLQSESVTYTCVPCM